MVKKQPVSSVAVGEESENLKKVRTKPSRKETRASIVSKHRSLMQTAQSQRRAASRIPRDGESDDDGEMRLQIKAVGFPVLLRDADADLFFDKPVLLSRTRQAGSRAGMRTNKKGEQVMSILRTRATDEATELLMQYGIAAASEFMQNVQRSVRGAKRKNVSPLDIHLARECRKRY